METFAAFIIAAAVTWFFVRGYLRKLTAHERGGSSAPVALQSCPRCGKSMAKSAGFCPSCGAAQAMWKVLRAEVHAGGGPVQGRPKPVVNAGVCVGCGSCVQACPEAGALQVVEHKSKLVNPDLCTGAAKCAAACPTGALTLVIGGAAQTVKVPFLNEHFETNVPGIYIVGELGGMGMIKNAINEGKLVIDHIKRLPAAEGGQSGDDVFDVAIVGAGPAGLSASLTAFQHGLRYLTLEQGEIASTIRNYPRQKFVMAEPVQIPLYGSLYVADSSKESLLSVWETILANTGVQVQTNETVQQIRKNETCFHLDSTKGQYRARHVVLAMGRRGTPRRLGVPGEDSAKVCYRLIEAESYASKRVLVVGGGDSALEAVLALGNSGSRHVALSYRGENFEKARERNRERLQTAQEEGKVEVLLKSKATRITPESVLLDCSDGARELPNDYVFALIGGESPDAFLIKTGVSMVEKVLSS